MILKQPKTNKSVNNLLKSFQYAFEGIFYAIIHERNIRIHIVAATFIFWLSSFYNLSKAELTLLILTVSFVIFAELVNSAIEAAVDLISPKYNILAKISKDIAAGAVFVSAVTAIVIGIILFFDLSVLTSVLSFLFSSLKYIVLLIIALIASLFFIFGIKDKNNNI